MRTIKAGALWALAVALLGGCATFSPRGERISSELFNARIIYVIHGDGEHGYHDSAGRHHRADEDILEQAKDVGQRAFDSEVLIFHQSTSWGAGIVGVFEGTFYHYRYGTLQRHKPYYRKDGTFDTEADLIRRFAAPSALVAEGVSPEKAEKARRIPTVLAYFGHEIPQTLTSDDDTATLIVTRFTAGLRNLAVPLWALDSSGNVPAPTAQGQAARPGRPGPAKPYGLIILSTCYGGTPRMISALTPLADYAVASPAYLHLSHMDTRALAEVARVDTSTGVSPWKILADTVAAQSFDRLKTKTLTEVTVATYELKTTHPFALSFSKLYAKTYAKTDMRTARSSPREDSAGTRLVVWRDCAVDSKFNDEQAMRGVKLRYRPALFGSTKTTATRSAWQCPY
jgi:hypothetical protein